jgi:hypothetical protein
MFVAPLPPGQLGSNSRTHGAGDDHPSKSQPRQAPHAGCALFAHWQVPEALQTIPVAQVPHETVPPHPLDTEPQVRPAHAEEFGVQPHTLTVPPPPQVCGATQLLGHVPPHALEPPHLPVQLGVHPQTLAVTPPPQVCGATQLSGHVPPHASEPPHLPVQLGVHPHTLAVPPPPQVCGAVQPPQSTDCPQLLSSVPQWLPHV